MAQDEKKSDDWKNDEFVVCLQRVKFLENDWNLLKKFYDERDGFMGFAEVNGVVTISEICVEVFGFTKLQGGAVGKALVDEYFGTYGKLARDIKAILGDMDKDCTISEEIAGILDPFGVTLEKMSEWKESKLEEYVESLPLKSVVPYQRIPINQEFIIGIKKLNARFNEEQLP